MAKRWKLLRVLRAGFMPGWMLAAASARRARAHQAHLRDLAARSARGLHLGSPSLRKEGAGRPGARCTRGLVCNCAQRTRTRAYRSSGEHPAFPAQWFYGVLRALPGVRIPLATVIRELMDGAEPGRAGTSSADLTPATGARTTRLYFGIR